MIREAESFVASGAPRIRRRPTQRSSPSRHFANRQNNRMNLPVPEERLKTLMSNLADGIASGQRWGCRISATSF
jgi:hypothetical protein